MRACDRPNDFSHPVRVYYEDTDSGGIVYYANYLKFMERARTEFLRELGFEQDHIRLHSKRLFVVKTVTVNYVSPAVFNALLDVTVSVGKCKRASVTFLQQVWSAATQASTPTGNSAGNSATNVASTLNCEATVQLACLNSDTLKPAPIPSEIKEALSIER
ncbi:MAG: tol-pal system-associated acyl-CoA thioesterase [Gammaproteobacteria bacterium]|nr:tol-pal system-associated acyl-CoA thioesterase [Gammaproteobacteria bacterium]